MKHKFLSTLLIVGALFMGNTHVWGTTTQPSDSEDFKTSEGRLKRFKKVCETFFGKTKSIKLVHWTNYEKKFEGGIGSTITLNSEDTYLISPLISPEIRLCYAETLYKDEIKKNENDTQLELQFWEAAERDLYSGMMKQKSQKQETEKTQTGNTTTEKSSILASYTFQQVFADPSLKKMAVFVWDNNWGLENKQLGVYMTFYNHEGTFKKEGVRRLWQEKKEIHLWSAWLYAFSDDNAFKTVAKEFNRQLKLRAHFRITDFDQNLKTKRESTQDTQGKINKETQRVVKQGQSFVDSVKKGIKGWF